MPIERPLHFMRYTGRNRRANYPWRIKLMHGAVVVVNKRQLKNKIVPAMTRGKGFFWAIPRRELSEVFARNPELGVQIMKYTGPTMRPGPRRLWRPALYKGAQVALKEGEFVDGKGNIIITTRGKGFEWHIPPEEFQYHMRYLEVPRDEMYRQVGSVRRAISQVKTLGVKKVRKLRKTAKERSFERTRHADYLDYLFSLPSTRDMPLSQKKKMVREMQKEQTKAERHGERASDWTWKLQQYRRFRNPKGEIMKNNPRRPSIQTTVSSQMGKLTAVGEWRRGDLGGHEFLEDYRLIPTRAERERQRIEIIGPGGMEVEVGEGPRWKEFSAKALRSAALKGKPISQGAKAMKAAARMYRAVKNPLALPAGTGAAMEQFGNSALSGAGWGTGFALAAGGLHLAQKSFLGGKKRRNPPEKQPRFVSEVPQSYLLVTDTQEVRYILRQLGQTGKDAASVGLFVIPDYDSHGDLVDYAGAYKFQGKVPYLSKPVVRVRRPNRRNPSRSRSLAYQYTSPTLSKSQFFGHWRWVHHRICPNCGHDNKLLGNDTRRPPSLPRGGVQCSKCGEVVRMGNPRNNPYPGFREVMPNPSTPGFKKAGYLAKRLKSGDYTVIYRGRKAGQIYQAGGTWHSAAIWADGDGMYLSQHKTAKAGFDFLIDVYTGKISPGDSMHNPFVEGEAVAIPGMNLTGTVSDKGKLGGGLLGGGKTAYRIRTNEPSPKEVIVRESGLRPLGGSRNPRKARSKTCSQCGSSITLRRGAKTVTCRGCGSRFAIKR